MYLWMIKLITRPKLVNIIITYVVINAVGKVVKEQGFKSLKCFIRNTEEIISTDVDLAGPDHQQQIEQIE